MVSEQQEAGAQRRLLVFLKITLPLLRRAASRPPRPPVPADHPPFEIVHTGRLFLLACLFLYHSSLALRELSLLRFTRRGKYPAPSSRPWRRAHCFSPDSGLNSSQIRPLVSAPIAAGRIEAAYEFHDRIPAGRMAGPGAGPVVAAVSAVPRHGPPGLRRDTGPRDRRLVVGQRIVGAGDRLLLVLSGRLLSRNGPPDA